MRLPNTCACPTHAGYVSGVHIFLRFNGNRSGLWTKSNRDPFLPRPRPTTFMLCLNFLIIAVAILRDPLGVDIDDFNVDYIWLR